VTAAQRETSRKIVLRTHLAHGHGALGYLELGRPDTPCVVFLHGFGADLLTWQLCLVPLSSQYRVVALDLPGHGRTTPDVGDASLGFMTRWLDEAFDVLGISEAHLVGHSMGAKIAMAFALSHPERVASLALISPAGLGGEFHHDTLDAFLHDPGHAEILAAQLVGPRGPWPDPCARLRILCAVSPWRNCWARRKPTAWPCLPKASTGRRSACPCS